MKKILIVVALLALSFSVLCGCGGGGASGPSMPPGENTGIPSVVQLLPSTFIAQTNTFISLHTKVLDGNGIPLANIPVTFTNLSHPFGIMSSTVANTDAYGIATVTLYSTSPGFATILAQVNSGSGQVRDRKSVFFSTLDVLAVSMTLDVQSVPGDGTYNKPSDFIIFEPPPTPDNTVEVLATVFNAGGVPVGGGWSVCWSASHTEASFVRKDTETNVFGQAQAIVQITPESIRDTDTTLNIMAMAGNGAANMVTLFLKPVIVSSVTVTADPSSVETGETSDITAIVMLNTGDKAPDGTSVSFKTCDDDPATPELECTASCGLVTPFAQTAGGIAEAQYTAPSEVPTYGVCTVVATAGGVSGSVAITVTVAPTALTITPPSASASCGGSAVTFFVTGGVPPYTATSTNAIVLISGSPISSSGGSFTATTGLCTGLPASTDVSIIVQDSAASPVMVTVTLTVTNP